MSQNQSLLLEIIIRHYCPLKDAMKTNERMMNMPKAASIGESLKLSLFLSGSRQKELAIDAKTPNATISDHLNGANVSIDKAIEYLEVMKSNGYQATNELTGSISYQYLGFFKSMDGQMADVKSTNDLEVFQEIESNERKERKKTAQRLAAESQVRMLSQTEKTELRGYVDEFLDEIVVEMAIVFSILKILRLNIQDVIQERMPHWIKKRYMKG